MKIRTFREKILWTLVCTVAVLTMLELVLFDFFIRKEILRKTEVDLQKARAIYHTQQTQRFQKLEEVCSRLVGSRRLAAALEEGDPRVLEGVLQNEQEISKLAHTFLAIADRKGEVIVRGWDGKFSIEAAGAQSPEQGFLKLAKTRQSERFGGYFTSADQIFEAMCVPLRTGQEQLGSIVVAFAVTDETARELASALGFKTLPAASTEKKPSPKSGPPDTQDVEVGFMANGKIVASTLGDASRRPLESRLNRHGSQEQIDLKINGIPYSAFVNPLTRGEVAAQQVILLSQRSGYELLATLWRVTFFSDAVILLLCLWVGSRLARQISAPVSELEAGARQIREGKLDVRVTPRTSDEVGRLAEAFNAMAADLQLKEKYRGVLDKVVSPEVATELLSGKIELGGELRSVTVLFCDIRGFTKLTEGMKPRDLLALLNEHMTAMTEIVRRHGGIVDKFIGDQLMAIFGAPRSAGNSARAALSAAVELRTKRREMNKLELPTRQIEIGLGLDTGEVVAGNMGSDKQHSYTVLGKTVNRASRLCLAARPMQVLATETTVGAAGKGVVATAVNPITAKGFSEPIPVLEVGTVE